MSFTSSTIELLLIVPLLLIQLQGTLNPLTDLSAGSYSGTYTYQA
ncbi:MAG: hypothetical protein OK442_05135 [Thaumarchaeota archaeon]|nr:hypothetical protein [Nitrososphaerota archaeon]